MTLSGQTSSNGGILRTTVLAVFGLITARESSDRSQPKQPSQNQVDRDKIIQEAGHDEDQYAEDYGERRTQVCDPYRHAGPLFTAMSGAAPYGVAVCSGWDGRVPMAVEIAARLPVIQ
jgi:hypothetical protein